MQLDDAANPATLWVQGGERAWGTPPAARMQQPGVSAASPKACADCHGRAQQTMRTTAASYPKEVMGADGAPRIANLAERIEQCRTQHQGQGPLPREHATRLELEAYLASLARQEPQAAARSAAMDAMHAQGEQLWRQRMGQLDLACAHCHDQRAGLSLGGSVIPQAHPGGYPVYRLAWQTLGSLQRRMRGCMVGVRAEPFAARAVEWLALEVFLARRAEGMPLEAPGVRP